MSLKAFHLVFIVAAILLAFGFAAWALWNYSEAGRMLHLLYGIGSAAAGVGLIFYFKYVLRKLKDMPYL